MKVQNFVRGGLALAIAVSITAPAHAQNKREARLLDPFRECGAVQDSDARLACFDNALAGLSEAQEEENRRSELLTAETFGMRASAAADADVSAEAVDDTAKAALSKDEDGNYVLTMTIADVFVDKTAKMVILFENGQLWRETGNGNMRGKLRAGWIAEIAPSGFGGYRLKIQGRNGFLGIQRVK